MPNLWIMAKESRDAHRVAQWLGMVPKSYVFLDRVDQLRGVDRPRVLMYETAWRHPRYRELYYTAKLQHAFISALNDVRYD